MNAYYDPLETRDAQRREHALFSALQRQLAHAKGTTRAFAELLRDVEPSDIDSRAALSRLPVMRKHELLERQKAHRATDPFGGVSAIGWHRIAAPARARRVFQSPGPIYEPEGRGPDYWRMARALYAAGFRAGDLVHNSFSYHLTPAGSMLETGAHAIGCTVVAGGVGNTELQLQAITDLRPDGYIGTPSFLKLLVERAEQSGVSLAGLRKAKVSGEAFPPSLRAWLQERGIEAYQSYATADVGCIAYETTSREGLVVDEGVIVEIVQPDSGEPVAEGEVGEVVVTPLNHDYPLIRFGTGDLSAVLPGACPTGRTNMRLRGWMGRADQVTKVRGMFVHPSHVADVIRPYPEISRARLVVSGAMASDEMTLHVEAAETPEALPQLLVEALRRVTKLRGDVIVVPPGTLPNDGKVIEDARKYE